MMMKKTFTTLLLGFVFALCAHASSTWTITGTEYRVDTLFHNQVATGTTQTSLWFHNASGATLRVFYCTMDMTNPYLSLRGVCATDKLAGNERISAMAIRKSKPGQRYIVGINGDFFVTSGSTSRQVSRVGSPVGSTVVDGTIFRARNNTKLYKNFVVDTQGQLFVNPFTFGGNVTGPGGTSAPLGGINTYGSDSYTKNKITVYNDLYYGSTDESTSCSEVSAVLADGEKFATAKPCKMVVTSAPSTAGDMTIPAGGYVIHAHGTACSFVNALKEGDTVTVSPSWTYNGTQVEPYQVVSGNPKILSGGVTLNTESDRGDARSQHPRSGIGFSDDGKKAYFFVVDGRSSISNGVRTTALADIMRYAGVQEAMNLDGGGSSVLYTSTLGIRNKPSDGSERADGNGFYLVNTAPDDDSIAEIRFVDFSLKAPRYGIYTPKFYGYNQYGMLVSQDVKGVVLSCDESIGHIQNDTTFYADGTAASGLLKGTYKGAVVTMPMEIANSVDNITITNDSIINDTYLAYPIAVQSTVIDKVMSINPAALTWASSDESIVTVGANTGVLQGVKDGVAYVYGKIGEVSDTMKVIVEKPTAHVMPIDPALDISTWKISQVGGTGTVATASGNGIDYTYTGAAGRAPKIVLTKQIRLWSLPDTLRIRLNPGEAPVKNFVFSLRPGSGSVNYVAVTPDALIANRDMNIDLPTSSWIDASDMGNYPITFNSVQINMNASTTGKVYNMKFLGFETIYKAVEGGMKGDVNGDNITNVSDVTELINMILGLKTPQLTVADLNGDGIINVTDVTELINMILNR